MTKVFRRLRPFDPKAVTIADEFWSPRRRDNREAGPMTVWIRRA